MAVEPFDPDRLVRALDWIDRVGYAATDDVAVVVALEAARALLDGRESLWCVSHASTGPTDPDGRGVCWFFMFAEALRTHAGSTTQHLPCRMVPVRVVPVKEQK
jgi:hypothetical protein